MTSLAYLLDGKYIKPAVEIRHLEEITAKSALPGTFVVRDTRVKPYSRKEKTKFTVTVGGETLYLGVIFAVDQERQQVACWWLHGTICCCSFREFRSFTENSEIAKTLR